MDVSGKQAQVLTKLSARVVAEQNQDYVDKRRKGLITSMKTKFPRLDNYLMGGIELDTIVCVAALSGAGKSTIAKCLRDSIWELNALTDFNQYIFNFEMVAHQQAARSVVTSANIAMKRLYSVDDPLTDEEFEEMGKYYDELKSREGVWFIENPGTAKQIADSLRHYYLTECKPTNRVCVYEIDHALLTKGRQGQSEKERVDDLMLALVEVKKQIASDGGHSIGIVLSQMNREIRDKERIKNKEMHRPGTECLFGASSIEQCCDYVLFSHIPAKLNIPAYTVNNYPTKMVLDGHTVQIPYFELVKQRSGEADLTIPMWNKLSRFDFDEMPKDVFYSLVEQFHNTGEVIYDTKSPKSLF
jgi:replicative DNA helicase